MLCVLYIRWKVPILQLGRRWLVFDGKLLRKTVSYGWASAMQQATVQLGKIAVQAIVNTMGVNAMAAFTAASRIDDFAYTPQQNIGHAMTTLMAQNRGAGKHDRVKQGFHCGMRIEAAVRRADRRCMLFRCALIMKLFVTDPEVVHLGVRFLRTVSLFYLMPAATNGIQGFFRGIGDLKVTLVSSTFNMVFRVAAAAVFVLVWKMEIEALPYSYAVGWVVMLLYELPHAGSVSAQPWRRIMIVYSICDTKRLCIARMQSLFRIKLPACALASRVSIFFSGSMMLETDMSWFRATTK